MQYNSEPEYFLCNIYTVSCQPWWYKFVFILYASALHMWTNSKYVICLRRFSSFKSFPLYFYQPEAIDTLMYSAGNQQIVILKQNIVVLLHMFMY